MKKTLIAGIFFSVVAFTAIVAAKHFWRGEILPAAEVCAKWGEAILNVEKFKDGDEKLGSKMACSLLKNQKLYIGKTGAISDGHSAITTASIFPTCFQHI